MLLSLHLRHFKSFHAANALFGPVTFIVGPNGAGKSNLLDAVRFLQGVYLEMHVNDVFHGQWSGGRKTWPGIRGGKMEGPTYGHEQFTIEANWKYRRQGLQINSSVTYTRDAHPGLNTDNYFRPATPTHLRVVSGDEEVIPWQDRPEWFRHVTRQILFFDPRPELMRGFVEPYMANLGTHGENLSAVLYQRCQDATFLPLVRPWLRRFAGTAIDDLDFLLAPETSDVLLKVIGPQGSLTARSLSDGALRMLALMAALVFAPKGAMLVIDGLERDLSPANIPVAVEMIEALAAERDLQVLATTHSVAALEALSEEAFGHALGLRPGSEGTEIRRAEEFLSETGRRAPLTLCLLDGKWESEKK